MTLPLNLLPQEYIDAQKRAYHIRLAVVGLALMCALILIAALLLLPTYKFLSDAHETQQRILLSREQDTTTPRPDIAARLKELDHNERILLTFRDQSTASEIFEKILTVARRGVKIVSLNYTAPTPEQQSVKALVSGIASDRDALQSYTQALESSPLIASVELPLSAYAKDTEIPFAVTVTFKP